MAAVASSLDDSDVIRAPALLDIVGAIIQAEITCQRSEQRLRRDHNFCLQLPA